MLFALGSGLMVHLSDKEFFEQIDAQKKYDDELGLPDNVIAPTKRKLSKKISRKIDKMSLMDIEDIAEQAIAEAARRIRVKDRRKLQPKSDNIKWTGYWQPRNTTTKIYGYELDGRLFLCIKGGKHELLKYELDGKERVNASLMINRMLGYTPKKLKNGSWRVRFRSGKDRYEVYISKTGKRHVRQRGEGGK